jgi:hypothetical protein
MKGISIIVPVLCMLAALVGCTTALQDPTEPSITISEKPSLLVFPHHLDFGEVETNLPFSVCNEGTGTLEFSIEKVEDVPWLVLDPQSGSTEIDCTVFVIIKRKEIPEDVTPWNGGLRVLSNGGTALVDLTVTKAELKMTIEGTTYSGWPPIVQGGVDIFVYSGGVEVGTATSDSDGRYRIEDLPLSSNSMQAVLDGYFPITVDKLTTPIPGGPGEQPVIVQDFYFN